MSKDYKVHQETIRFGSGFIFVTDWKTGKRFCLGSMNNIKFQESYEKTDIKADNTGVINSRIKNHKATISGDLLEINLKKLAVIRGGIDVYETTPGTLKTVTQTFKAGTTAIDQVYQFDLQNYDNVVINVTSVEQGATKTLLVKDTDYIISTQEIDGDMISVISFLAGNAYDNTESITITYEVTPLAKAVFSTGGLTTINYLQAEIINTDQNGKEFKIELFKASNAGGLELDFKADDADESATTPISIEGVVDKYRAKGKQLFTITDEQGVA